MGEDRTARGAVEARSIDFVPHAERHGAPWHLAAVWFMGNAALTTVAVGFVGIGLGANLIWSLIAAWLGCLFGTVFMAFHSAQGPKLGLPQMVQSRPQFGYTGAAVTVFAAVLIFYVGFNVFNQIIVGQAIGEVTGVDADLASVLVAVVAGALAIWGYDQIHRAQRWLAGMFIVAFGIFTIGALVTIDLPEGALSLSAFAFTPFLAQFTVTAAWQLGWAIYVSDYSRYLPANVSVARTTAWTYLGSAVGAVWLISLGAMVMSGYPDADLIGGIRATGDGIFDGFGAIALIVAVPGLISVIAMNCYGAALTLISIADSFRPVRPQLWHRVAGAAGVALIGVVGAIAAPDSFLTEFNNFLLLILYLFIPWTSINLVDFYVVRRGRYAITEFFRPDGVYGRWGWRGIAAYVLGFAAMAPFFTSGWFTGPVAEALDGVDIALLVGLPVSALLYYLFTRSLDLDAEERAIEAEGALARPEDEAADAPTLAKA
jgi:NCS1 family nucleobase:cation symporter-1